MNPRRTIQIIFAAALGVMAIFVLPGLASAKDRNHDHIPDRWEQRHNLSLQVNQAGRDQDGDHLRNRAEFLAGDNQGGQGEEPGDDNGGENSGPGSSSSGPGNGGGAICTTTALVPGAVVQQADLEVEQGVATFDEVELAPSN
ncbi:MAG: hypothetical protein H0X42_06060 [Solirubrobacterales bacterium]|nr:hypothetical protein [Solirubrobacterales bacterium]